jgi:hypothetical protein
MLKQGFSFSENYIYTIMYILVLYSDMEARFWEMSWQTRLHGATNLGHKLSLGVKRVRGYKNEKLWTPGSQLVTAESTRESMDMNKQQNLLGYRNAI